MDWAKIAPIGLGASLLAVMLLTLIAGLTKKPADDFMQIVYNCLDFAFSVFEGDSEAFRTYTSEIGFFPDIFPILVPVFTTATAVTLIWNYLPHHVPWFSRVWYIFSELEPNSIRMAKSLPYLQYKLADMWESWPASRGEPGIPKVRKSAISYRD